MRRALYTGSHGAGLMDPYILRFALLRLSRIQSLQPGQQVFMDQFGPVIMRAVADICKSAAAGG